MIRNNYAKPIKSCLLFSLFMLTIYGCNMVRGPEVVIYASVDQMYAEPVLMEFQARTGIRVKAVYDVEATKTTGMINRLIAEKSRPLADVFWNGEIIQTILLKEEGVLAPFVSERARSIPKSFVDPDGYWVGFGGRARVIVVNADLLSPDEYPTSINDFLDPVWDPQRIGFAYPMFGTTATHFAVLYHHMGRENSLNFFNALANRGVRVLTGNATVRDQVADGQLLFGLTDTDDVCAAVMAGKPVDMVFPDAAEDESGTLIIPNTVARVNSAKNEEQAQALIDYLLSEEVEQLLMEMGWIHLPLRDIRTESPCFDKEMPKIMDADFISVYKDFEKIKKELTEIFIR